MDPATIVVAALVRVLTERFALDAYEMVKKRLVDRYGGRVAAGIARLEGNPASPERQQELAGALREAGADADTEILDLANQLTRQIVDLGSSGPPPDPVEAVQRRAGVRAVEYVMDDHVKKVLSARATYPVEDHQLLTSRVAQNPHLPEPVRNDLGRLHGSMRGIIEKIAVKIEERKYAESEQAILNLPVGLVERERAGKLMRADKQVHMSYQTLRTTVEFFSEFNRNILTRIENTVSPAAQSNMMLGNAIMLYELSDFVIAHIEGFAMRGVEEIESLYAEIKKKFAEARAKERRLAELAERPEVSAETRQQAMQDIRNRDGAIEELEREWRHYVDEVKHVNTALDEVRAMIPTLEVIRANAESQISVLQLVALLGILKQNLETVRGTVDALQGFRLAPLTSNRVRRLLSI